MGEDNDKSSVPGIVKEKDNEEVKAPVIVDSPDDIVEKTEPSDEDGSKIAESTDKTGLKKLLADKKFKILILAILLIGAGAYAYVTFFLADSLVVENDQSQEAENSPLKSISPNKDVYMPRFDSINDVEEFGDATWYATPGGVIEVKNDNSFTIFTTADGITPGNTTELEIYDDKLWLSTQNGVTYFENGKFNTSIDDIENGDLFYDKYDDNLYLSTFDGLMEYRNDEWVLIPGLEETYNINSGKNGILASSRRFKQPAFVFNRQTDEWDRVKSKVVDTEIAGVFRINDEVFMINRSPGYSSCGDKGSKPATAVVKLEANGSLSEVKIKDYDLNSPELLLSESLITDSIYVENSSCSQDEKHKRYTVTYDAEANELALGDERIIDDNNGYRGYNEIEQSEIQSRLVEVLGYNPINQIFAIESDGTIWFGTDNRDNGTFPKAGTLAVAELGDFTSSQTIESPDDFNKWSTVVPIVCSDENGQTNVDYIFYGNIQGSEGGPTGFWAKTMIYPISNNQLDVENGIDLENNLAAALFSCDQNKINWIGKTKAMSLTRANSDIAEGFKVSDANLTNEPNNHAMTNTGNFWVGQNVFNAEKSSKTWTYVDINNQKTQKVENTQSTYILAGSDDSAWVYDIIDKNMRLIGLDGNIKATVKSQNIPSAVFTNNGSFIAHSPEGEFNRADLVFKTVDETGLDTGLENNSPVRYTYNDQNVAVYDPARNMVWLNESQSGVFPVELSN